MIAWIMGLGFGGGNNNPSITIKGRIITSVTIQGRLE